MRYYEIVGEDVFHGSPHMFDKFSTNNINTGEKNQAYGWGLYFASDADVADYYRETLSISQFDDRAESIFLDGKLVSGNTPQNKMTAEERAALQLWYNDMSLEAAIRDLDQNLENLITDFRTGEKRPNYQEMPVYKMDMETRHALTTIDFTGRIKPYRGSFYHAEIPDSEDYLYWDAPVSRQSAQVKKALTELGVSVEDKLEGAPPDRPIRTGKTAYLELARTSGSPKNASLALFGHGIPGIKYKDGNTRRLDDEDAMYNYVIFDDSLVKMKNTRTYNY